MQRFYMCLLRSAARLNNSVSDDAQGEISALLKNVGRFWKFDFIHAGFFRAGGTRNLHGEYHYPLIPGTGPVVTIADLPWTRRQLTKGKTVVIPWLHADMPAAAEIDRQRLLEYGVSSTVVLPLKVGGNITGWTLLGNRKVGSRYSEECLGALHTFSDILAGALDRLRTWIDIEASHRWESLLSEVSAKYISLPIDDIEPALRSDFGRLAKLLDVDRCSLHIYGRNPLGLENISSADWFDKFAWWPEGDERSVDTLLAFGQSLTPEQLSKLNHKMSEKLRNGEVYRFPGDLEQDQEDIETRCFMDTVLGVQSVLSVPVTVGGTAVGGLTVASTKEHREWGEDEVTKVRLFGEIFINAIIRKHTEDRLRRTLAETELLKKRIEADYAYMREETRFDHNFRDIVGRSRAMTDTLKKAVQVAPTDSTVLLQGETGTGKGVIAQAIHNASRYHVRPLVQVNCAALSPTLIESELFGHEKGAFTGAYSRKIGRFELAGGTTLFLDEIGELSLTLQAKLLRVLQERAFERVGGTTTIRVDDVRIIAATNRDLQQEVAAGRFRQDLWYRLNVFPITVPPLRDRLEDVPLFVAFFAGKFAGKLNKRFDRVPQSTLKRLQNHHWPGNIRELENLIERAVITSPGSLLKIDIPSADPCLGATSLPTLAAFERSYILEILDTCNWKVSGPGGAAEILGMHPETLRSRMRKFCIRRPDTPVGQNGTR